jgi:hypothetical protein
LVEHADGRLEIIDVEALLREAGWKPDPAEHPEHLNIPELVAEEGGVHAH